MEEPAATKKTTKTSFECKNLYAVHKTSDGSIKLSSFKVSCKISDFFEPSTKVELETTIQLVDASESDIKLVFVSKDGDLVKLIGNKTIKTFKANDLSLVNETNLGVEGVVGLK